MALTPADVHNVAFNKPPLGRRGYNEDEVDAFLDRVEAEMIELVTERDSLREKLAAGGGGSVAAPPVLTPATRGTSDDGALKAVTAERDKLKERIAELERQAASKPATASDEGDDRVKALEEARSERDGLKNEIASLTNQYKTLSTERDILKVKTGQLENALKEAQSKLDAPQDPTAPATRLMAMAQEVADRLHADAKAEAARTVSEATKQADALLGKAREQANATEGELSRRRVELESKIDQLKAFEREYRTHLRTYLTSQLSELDEEKQLVGKK